MTPQDIGLHLIEALGGAACCLLAFRPRNWGIVAGLCVFSAVGIGAYFWPDRVTPDIFLGACLLFVVSLVFYAHSSPNH